MSGMQKCPYCGSDTRLNKFSKRIGKIAPHVLKTAQVHCKRKTCGMSGPLFKGEDCAKDALKHWSECYFHPSMRKRHGPEKPVFALGKAQ